MIIPRHSLLIRIFLSGGTGFCSRNAIPVIKLPQWSIRNICSYKVKIEQETRKTRLRAKLRKWLPFLVYKKGQRMATSYNLFTVVMGNLDYTHYRTEWNLPDTFHSWFIITELHIWMFLVRLSAEGEVGDQYCQALSFALWDDCMMRLGQLGVTNHNKKRDLVKELGSHLSAAVLGYDEGLDGNDVHLAAAVWRRIYSRKDVKLHKVFKIVKYIRENISFLDQMPTKDLLNLEEIHWGIDTTL